MRARFLRTNPAGYGLPESEPKGLSCTQRYCSISFGVWRPTACCLLTPTPCPCRQECLICNHGRQGRVSLVLFLPFSLSHTRSGMPYEGFTDHYYQLSNGRPAPGLSPFSCPRGTGTAELACNCGREWLRGRLGTNIKAGHPER